MAYRRKPADAEIAARWSEWRRTSLGLAEPISLPISIFDALDRFQQFLMHGHDSATGSHLRPWPALTEHERAGVLRLVRSFLEAGFADPGIAIVSPERLTVLERELHARKT